MQCGRNNAAALFGAPPEGVFFHFQAADKPHCLRHHRFVSLVLTHDARRLLFRNRLFFLRIGGFGLGGANVFDDKA